jgi:hypothetical protein
MENGMYTNTELVDAIIVDLNNLSKSLIDGQFINFCTNVSQMAQKLVALREGIKTETSEKNRVIEELKTQLRNIGADVKDITAEEFVEKMAKKDGAK